MAEKEVSSPQGQPLPDKLPELAQLIMENEKLRRKHRKVQHRRDHYARLYYRCQADLDEKKWELHFARIKIREMKAQIVANSLPPATSQEHPSPLTSSRSEVGFHPSQRAHPNYVTHSHRLYSHTQQQHHQHNTPSNTSGPSSIPPRPVPCHGSESNSTSPDSGASFSPGMGMGTGSDPLRHSCPASAFSQPQSRDTAHPRVTRTKTLPNSIRFLQGEDKLSGSTPHANGYTSDSERESEHKRSLKKGGCETGKVGERKLEGEDWVAWVKERHLPPHHKVPVSAMPVREQPQDGWKEGKREKQTLVKSNTGHGHVGGENTATPRSPIHFKTTVAPSNILASPQATHHRHPSFEPKPSPGYGYSLSQGTSLPHSPLSPPLPHPQTRKRNGPPTHVNFSLSQEAYVSSPLYLRKPAFRAASSHRNQSVTEAPKERANCQSPLGRVTPPPQVSSEAFSDSELDTVPSQNQSAFRKPPVYRQLSQPARLVSPPTQRHPQFPGPCSPPTVPHLPPSHSSPQSPPHHSTHPHTSHSHPQQNHFHPPPPPPTSHPPSLHTSHTRTHAHRTHPNSTLSPQSPIKVGVAHPEMGVVSQISTHQTDHSRSRRVEDVSEDLIPDEQDNVAERGTREGDSEESYYEGLNAVEMLDLLSKISDPNCIIKKLEISDSGLGKPEAMSVLCSDLHRNKSLRVLSLPNNRIGAESLQLLLECIQHCTNIRELKLRGNNIGKRCAPLIKALMEQTRLDSLVLTGNEIEQHGDLLHRSLPSDFTMEYDTAEGSVDSGVVVADTDQYQTSPTSLKYLHV